MSRPPRLGEALRAAEPGGIGMIARSYLFVPADSEKKLAKARSSSAGALILDLEDSVPPEHRPKARELVREFLAEPHSRPVWVRVNPVGNAEYARDLQAICVKSPAGIVVPKVDGPEILHVVDGDLTVEEDSIGLMRGGIKVMPIATETPLSVLTLQDYGEPPPRLAALTWGAEDLSAALGAAVNREPDGEWTFTYKLVRSMALIAAKAAGVGAIETLHRDYRDDKGLERAARAARRDGFDGMLAIHPDQVEVINEAFLPSADEIAEARRVVEAFAAGESVAVLDGRLLDQPHLKRAQNVLACAEAQKKRES